MILVCAILVVGCTATTKEELTESGLKRSDFQTEVDGEKTDLFVLKNKNNMEVCITNFGGRIVSVMVPDKDGNMKDVVLGFDSIQDYIKYPSDFGASIGRYANRINQGRFTLDGVEYQLPQNNYGHCPWNFFSSSFVAALPPFSFLPSAGSASTPRPIITVSVCGNLIFNCSMSSTEQISPL